MQDFVISCIGHLENISAVSNAAFPKLTLFIIQYSKITYDKITDFIREVFMWPGVVRLKVADTHFLKF